MRDPEGAKFCAECRAGVAEGANFCSECGTATSVPRVADHEPEAASEAPGTSPNATLLESAHSVQTLGGMTTLGEAEQPKTAGDSSASSVGELLSPAWLLLPLGIVAVGFALAGGVRLSGTDSPSGQTSGVQSETHPGDTAGPLPDPGTYAGGTASSPAESAQDRTALVSCASAWKPRLMASYNAGDQVMVFTHSASKCGVAIVDPQIQGSDAALGVYLYVEGYYKPAINVVDYREAIYLASQAADFSMQNASVASDGSLTPAPNVGIVAFLNR